MELSKLLGDASNYFYRQYQLAKDPATAEEMYAYADAVGEAKEVLKYWQAVWEIAKHTFGEDKMREVEETWLAFKKAEINEALDL